MQLTLPGPGLTVGSLPVIEASPELSLKSGVTLRPYQAVRAGECISLLLEGKNPILEMATGTGKTAVAADAIRTMAGMGKRQLWAVHRIELVRQAKYAIEKATGLNIGLELPGTSSSPSDRIVVASKDTIRTSARLDRLKRDGFDIIWTDEAHHSPGKSYQCIYEAFPAAQRAGLTATVDRLDRQELSNYDSRVTPYTIVDGIEEGWLVPFKAKRVKVKAVDLSGIGMAGGDFNQGQLDLIIRSEQALHGIAQGLLNECGDRPTIVFCTGVDAAERLCEILERHRPGCAVVVTGTTPSDIREGLFARFGRTYQFLINVGVATEGTDLPAAACIAMARPTKSRSLFVQMLGRGGRPWPGLDLMLGTSIDARKLWVRNSPKPDCLVLDFVGVTGKHSVITVADAIGPVKSSSYRTVNDVSKAIEAGQETIDVYQALVREAGREQVAVERKAKAELARVKERQALVATVTLEVKEAALIGMGAIDPVLEPMLDLSGAASPGQVEQAQRLGVQLPDKCDKRKARFLIGEARVRANLATGPMLDLIRKHRPELVTPELTKHQAGAIIGMMKRTWKRGRTRT